VAEMKNSTKCIDLLDYLQGWSAWRKELKNVIDSSHTYYQDETVQLLLKQLDSFLARKVCVSSGEEEIIETMWEAATPAERKTIANLLLKISGNL
jgi:erythromycin esterase-like protein